MQQEQPSGESSSEHGAVGGPPPPASPASATSALDGAGSSEDTFSTPTFSVRAQKKIASQLASKKAVKIFLDASSARVFDKMYKIVKTHTQSRPAAQKLMKHIIKINLKIGILYLNDAFNAEEMSMADEFRDKFNDLATALVRMQKRQSPLNQAELVRQLADCEQLVLRLIRRHLSEKSLQTVRNCSKFFREPRLLNDMFDVNSPIAAQVDSLCDDVQDLLDRGVI